MDQTLPDDRPVAVRDVQMRRSTLPLPLSWRLVVFAASAWHALRAALSTAVAAATLVILFAPAIVFAVAGCWAVFTFANTLYTVWRLLEHWQLPEVFARLDILDAADRVALASAGYFALFFALVVLFAGLLGRHGQRLFLLPGLLFVIPSTALFGMGARLTGEELAARWGFSGLLPTALTLYALLDAIVLAAYLTDLRPRRRPRAVLRRGPQSDRPALKHDSAPLAVVCFGPSAPLDAVHTEVESVPESVSGEAAPPAPPADSVPFVVSKAPTEAPLPEDSIVSAPSADASAAAPSEDTEESASPAAPAPPPEAVAPLDIPEPRAAPAAAHETTPPAEITDEGATRPELVTLRNG
jgi:hypothetical protein